MMRARRLAEPDDAAAASRTHAATTRHAGDDARRGAHDDDRCAGAHEGRTGEGARRMRRKPATKPHATHATKATHKPRSRGFRGNPVYADLPQPLQWQLAHHKVVVVSFYNPSSDVDAISVAEAHAGAVDAGAGFLLVSVLDNKVAGILTALLPGGGLLPDPGVLVYRAPGDVALRLDGFADRDVGRAGGDERAGGRDRAPRSLRDAPRRRAAPRRHDSVSTTRTTASCSSATRRRTAAR